MTVINTNLLSLKGQHQQARTQSALTTSMERLSSGLRVNSAKDDAAGQAIGNRFQAQKTGLNQATRNANDGISLSQTAQGVLDSINDKLQRVRELTIQGLNSGTLDTRDSDAIQAEINFNLQEIDRLAEISHYNGIPLMTGQAGRVDLQVGARDGQSLGLDLSPPGFSVDALGLTDFNVAGEPGSVTPRDTLYGPARDIVLDDSRTTVNYPPGAEETLFRVGGAFYVSMGGGNYSRVDMNATHETATDLSEVNLTNPQALYQSHWSINDLPFTGLAVNESVVKAGDSYYIQRDDGGKLAYEAAEFEISFTGTGMPVATVTGGGELPGNYQAVNSFDFDGESYDLNDFTEIRYLSSGGAPLSSPELVEDQDNPGAFYLKSTDGAEVSYYRLDDIATRDNLDVTLSTYSPLDGETFQDVSTFEFGGTTYDVSDYDSVTYDDGAPVTIVKFVQSDDDGAYYAVDDNGDHFSIDAVDESRDMDLIADGQAYAGIDPENQQASPADFDDGITRTPEVIDFSVASPTFAEDGAGDLSAITNPELVQSTSSGQWVIRGELTGGGYGYYNADLEVTLDSEGNPVSYTATTNQSAPTTLGVDGHVVEKVDGISTVTIDPRNVSVEYTDIEGRVYTNVLTEGEDGNYYFELPGESSLRGGYKTATLVDHDQNGEIVLRTENGYSEVVVFYPTELEKGINKAFFVETDADGFSDDGTPHTRLRIQEVGEDFRIQMPRNPLAALDKAIGMVDSKRSYLGALDNRLASVIDSNEMTAINVAAAQSRIMDADYARETANLVRVQIIQQAGTSVMAQANIVPETVLALLVNGH